MTTHDDAYAETVAAFALDSLDEPERREFERHLASCPECRRELSELQRVSAGLATTVRPVLPPPSLKGKTMAAAMAEVRGSHVGPVVSRRAPRVSATWLALAATVALAAGLGSYALSLRSRVSNLEQSVRALSDRAESLRAEITGLRLESVRLTNVIDVLRAPDTLRVDLRGQGSAPGALGRAYLSRGRSLVLSVSDLPVLASDRVYQVWLIPAGGVPLSAGVFVVDAAGAGELALVLSSEPGNIRAIAVTVEPGPAGSPQGTTPPVLLGPAGD